MAVDLGPKLGFLINANIGEQYYDQFRPFLNAFDVLVQPRVTNVGTNTPPSSPTNGDTYVVGTTPNGAWTGQQNAIAVWSTEVTTPGTNTKVPAWVFFPAQLGMQVWNLASAQLTVFGSSGWQNLLAGVPFIDQDNNWVAPQTFEDGFGAAAEISIFTTAQATSSMNQASPVFAISGNYWDGTVSQPDTWTWNVQPATGTNPVTQYVLLHTGSTGKAQVNLNYDVFVESIDGQNCNMNGNVNGGPFNCFGGLLLYNNSAATSVFNSPASAAVFQSSYWNGSLSVPDDWTFQVVMPNGTNPTSFLTLSHTGTSSDSEFHVPNLNLDAAVTTNTATAGSQTLPANPLGFWQTVINGTTVKIPYYAA
jgi:hypothetical protein